MKNLIRRTAGAIALASLAAVPIAASAQSNGYPPRAYAYDSVHNLSGVIQSVQGSSFTLQSGETVFMHRGTVINPNGVRLQPGMRVTVSGVHGGHHAINANEIDVARHYHQR